MARRHVNRLGIKRSEVIDVLTQVRALILHVEARDLHAAILGTARERLATLVVIDGALACAWQRGGEW